LKPGIYPTFRGIVAQVRILGLKRAKMPFSAKNILMEMAKKAFSEILNNPYHLLQGADNWLRRN
jgi:hypothetical protein